MSLFDKISGLAIKAKENVVSKTFLSKDRRLEQPLSRDIDLNDIYFEKISNYGLPSAVQVVAFDCVASLLAVVSGQSKIKVFGKGISTLIHIPKSEGIKYMQFKTGYPILSVTEKANTIITLDLRTQSIRHTFKAPDIITCQAYYPGTDWLFIGYANGFIDVFDMMQGALSPYQIPDLAQNGKLVLDLQLHPTELNTLLIGYENKMFIWNIREQTIRRSFSLPQSTSLTCLMWSPHIARFMAGYDDGFIHLWDIKHEQKPIASRRLSENSVQSSQTPEPIYQMAWYTCGSTQRSYLVVAGGLNPTDIRGLNVLEYDLEGEQREPRKQTILPADVSHFMMLNKDLFYSGMADPLGIAIVDNDHSLRVFSLEHGFPSLQLPPALDFLSPFVLSVCYISQLPDQVYKKLTAITQQDYRVRHLPITGGIAGPDHVYQINSNDILLTVHKGEILKFWDASFTALRPLYSCTIRSSDHTSALLCCLDLNKETGILAVGYSDGSIVLYECCRKATASKSKAFIDSCDNTLQEISDLLQDMETEETSPPVQEDAKEPNEQNTEMRSKFNSFRRINEDSSDTAGYSAYMMITLGKAAVVNVMSITTSILAVATEEGKVHLVDIQSQSILFSYNIAQSDHQNHITLQTTRSEVDHSILVEKKPASIISLHYFYTYSLTKVTDITVQLFVGLSNGHVYQFDLFELIQEGNTLLATVDKLNEYLILDNTPLRDMHIVDIRGNLQLEPTEYSVQEPILTKEASQHSMGTVSSATTGISEETTEATSKTTSMTSNSSSNVPSKRMLAIGRSEYRQQEYPHFMICVFEASATVSLAGYNVKLFSREFPKDTKQVKSQIVQSNGSVCLVVLLDNGKLVFYSLPTLEPMMNISLPNTCLLSRLSEAILCSDGRIVFWTGQYELEQYSFVHKPDFPLGQSVILFDSTIAPSTHPSFERQYQKPKKSWLDTVAGAFQREPLTLSELDTIMGRVPMEDPDTVRQQKIEAYKAKMQKEATSSTPGGVFSQLGDKMNERGEKLNQMEQKFEELNNASVDFLKAVKEYNERQARKKWWEF